MIAVRPAPAFLVGGLLVLSGCASQEADAGLASGVSMTDPAGDDEVGELEGVVVTNEQVPIPGANVVIFHVLMEETHSATTGEDGRFAFSNLRPGEYLATAEALFFLNATKQIEVPGGQRPFVTFELVDVVKSSVMIETLLKKGFLNCSIATVGDGQMYGPANYCEALGSDQAKFPMPFLGDNAPTGVVLEAVWTPTTPATGTALEITLCNKKPAVADPRNCRDVVTNTYFRWIRGASPLVLRVNDLPWKTFQVYDTVMGDGGITGARAPVTFQQPFELWMSVCYVAACPADFQARPPK